MSDQLPAAPDLSPQEGLMRRFWRLARGYYTSPGDRRRAWLLTIAVVGLTLFQIGVQVRFNLWNRDFFNALENRDRVAFFGQMWMFGLLLGLAMVAAVAQLWARQALMLGWRRWLVHRLQNRWLENGRHYQLNFLPGAADNPDQRITEKPRAGRHHGG
jgi:putative ATP-binding cassette transporter